MLIGLTGKYCAGKNFIASFLEKRGLPVLDVDKLGYQALEMEKEKVFSQFGSDLRLTDGSVNRKMLGKKVFGNPKKLAALEDIVHPAANRLTEEWIARCQSRVRAGTEKGQSPICVINAALLHRSSVFNKLDSIIIVKAPFFTRLFRARRRDKLQWLSILKRFASQRDFDSQYLTQKAEIHIVENSYMVLPGEKGFLKLENHINELIDKLIEGIR